MRKYTGQNLLKDQLIKSLVIIIRNAMKQNEDLAPAEFGAPDLGPLEALQQTDVLQGISRRYVTTMVDAISECQSDAELANATSLIFQRLLCDHGHGSFPDRQLNKDIVHLVSRSFRDKVQDLVGGSAEAAKRAGILKDVIDVVFDELHERVRDYSAVTMSPQAVKIALKLLAEMLSGSKAELAGQSYSQSVELTAVILAHFLLDWAHPERRLAFLADCEELLFGLLGETLGIKTLNHKAFRREDLAHGRFMLLGKCLTSTGLDEAVKAEIAAELAASLETLVLNDKENIAVAEKRLMYFQAFLAAAPKAVVEEKLLPQVKFIMNRSSAFVRVNAGVIELLKGYSIEDMGTLTSWTTGLLSDELLMSLEDKEAVVKFLLGVHAICSEAHNMKQALINDVLLEKFKASKRGNTEAEKRQRLLHQVYALITAQAGEVHVSREVLQVVLEHCFSVKEEADVKGIASIVYSLVKLAEPQDVKEVLIPLIQKSPRIHLGQQTQILLTLMQGEKDEKEVRAIDNAVADQLQASLAAENFNSTQNYSSVLALSAYFATKAQKLNDAAGLVVLVGNDHAANYFLRPWGFVNGLSFIESKQVSVHDVKNHMLVIEGLIKYHYEVEALKPVHFTCLVNTLCESLLNLNGTFRENAVLTCFERLQYLESKFTIPLFQIMFEKISEVSSRPASKLAEDEHRREQGLMIGKKIQYVMKMLYNSSEGSGHTRSSPLEKQEFFLLLRTICHPYVSAKSKDLMVIMRTLTEIMDRQAELNGDNRELTLPSYFQKYIGEIIQYALVQRTGILSPNDTLREIGKNMLICLGWQGYLPEFIGQLVTILNYRPIERTVKLKALIAQEMGAIGSFDLQFYSVVTKDLQGLLQEKDKEIEKSEIQASQATSDPEGGAGAPEEVKAEEKKPAADPAAKAMTPAQLQAAMMKKMAAAGKAKKGGKPGAKGGKGAPAAKAQAPPAKKEEPKKEEEVVDKETRKRMDVEQLLGFCDKLCAVRAKQVQTVWEILRTVNQIKEANLLNYQDVTLKFTIMPAIRLLNYQCTRFSTYYFLENLFMDNRQTPFYGIRVPLMGCLLCVQENKIYQKSAYDFLKFFEHVRQAADFSDMDVGYLQMILMLANFILQSLEVNLSVKESALNVAQEILETNPRVKNMDLVRLTINMMKSNYIGKNLSNYLSKLIRRLSSEELAVVLQSLFDFDPIARQKLLNELLIQPEPLFCPVWFSTQMWILQFDDEFFSVSRKIWNRYGLVLRSGVLDISQEGEFSNIYHHLRSSNTAVFDMAVRAAIAAIEILQGNFDAIINDLLRFYHSEIVFVKQLNLEALERTGDDNNFEGNKRFNRVALPRIIERTSRLIPHASVQKLLDFFIITGSVDSDPAVSKQCLDAAEAIIHSRGPDYSGKILQILERFVEEAQDFKEESVHHAIVLIGTLSGYLDQGGKKKLVLTFEKMLQLLVRTKKQGASELVNKSICKCIPKLSRFFEDRSKQIFTEQFQILRAGKTEAELRGAAFACAGIVKGMGMKFLKERDVLGVLQKDCFAGKKADPLRLMSGLLLYETLSYSQGKAFEPNIREIIPNILTCISDPREPVRSCANAANKQVVQNLSNHAIKQVVPMFLEGLQTDNWRGKFAAVEAVGDMALCAPKQILGFLPDIVKALREVLNDTHEKVHEAALKAISKIGSVIKCPEIAELLDIIIKALGNSNDYLLNCLDALLETSFVHSIDAPSLSLLIPLVDIGLQTHDNACKQKASQLVGNICSLTQNPEDLLPYMKILIPAIKNSLFDSIPEIRASAAKALGKLSKGLGLANSIELLEWLNTNLHRKDLAASERAGAAQGLSEVVSSHGDNFFSNQCKEIISKARSQDLPLREAYRTVMAYLPTSFNNFVNYLKVLLPIMIEGLGDDSEEVRKVSLRNVKICINQYGKKAAEMLCTPILNMMFHEDSRVRMSSSILMYQLVKEMENDIIKSQPKYIDMQMKYQILSAMFILKFDPIEKVQTQAAQIWQSFVDAPVHILRMIIQTLIKMVFENIQSQHEELQEMGLACMRGLVEKFGERIVNQSLDIFENYLEQAKDANQTSGINRVILNMAGAASYRILSQIKNRLTTIADPFLINEDDVVRELAADVFLTIFKRLGDATYTQNTLDVSFLQKLNILIKDKTNEASRKETEYLMKSLKYMLDKQELRLEEKIMNLCGVPSHTLKTPLSTAQAVFLRAIAPKVAPLVFSKKFYNTLFSALKDELTNDPLDEANKDPERMQAILMCFAEIVACIGEHEYVTINEEIMDFHDACVKRQSPSLYVDLIQYYCKHTTSNYEKHAKFYTANVLKHMNSDDKALVEKVVSCITAIFDKLPKENQFALVPLLREAIEAVAVENVDEHLGECIYRKKVNTIKMLETKEGVKTLAGVIQNSIMHGQISVRVDSAYCFKYLIDFSSQAAIKTEVIKICGALIRVVNDKFTPDLKIQIFLALRLMLTKAAALVRAMVAPLQPTLLKAFGDAQSNETVRSVVIENLLLLIKMTPKADPIVKDLTSQIDGDKVDGEQKVQVSQALALILREKGKAIQEAISKQVYGVLTSVIEERKRDLNDKVIINASVGLGFLSAYSSDPSQMKDLFYAFDEEKDFRVSLGIKLGILMNGSAKIPDLEQLQKDAASCIRLALASESGITEIDGRDISEGRPDEDIFRFDGALGALGYIMDTYLRRLFKSDSATSKLLFKALADSEILQKLNAEDEFPGTFKKAGDASDDVEGATLVLSKVFDQVPAFISILPIPSIASKTEKISPEQAEVMRAAFAFVHKFYLDFESKSDGRPALLNLLQLTYNNGQDLAVSTGVDDITSLSNAYVRDVVCEGAQLQGVIPEQMKMVCNDIIFA